MVAYDAPAHGESSREQTNIINKTNALLTVKNEIGEKILVYYCGADTVIAVAEINKDDIKFD